MSENRNCGLPEYREIPSVGLYLKQAEKFLSTCVQEMTGVTITESMISNYVKQKLIANPVKKQYDREQLSELLFIAITKTVLSMENIRTMLEMQRGAGDAEQAYMLFREELSAAVEAVYGEKELPLLRRGSSADRRLLRSVVVAVAHKLYLEECFART